VVKVSRGEVLVVERSRAWAVVDGAEGPLVDGVVEPAIADTASQDGAFLARRDGRLSSTDQFTRTPRLGVTRVDRSKRPDDFGGTEPAITSAARCSPRSFPA
jgi:hypothetical protein